MSAAEGVLEAAAEVENFCRRQGWSFCFIGGVAVQRWGDPRFTQDVDLTLLTGWTPEAFLDALLAHFSGRMRDARSFAIQHRVLLARTSRGVDLDIALGAMPFEEESVCRASLWRISENVHLTTCSAEDLIVHKVFAGRDRDWSDVEGVLARQYGHLKLAQIRSDLQPLLTLKEEPQSLLAFEQLLVKVNQRKLGA